MKWKVWFYLGPTRFAIEFEGDYNFVCESASILAKKLGAEREYCIQELK